MELDVIPLGQMWPDPNNPRKDFGDLDAMAATFEGNVVRPFEPVNPPVVVPDGEIEGRAAYRIVDGERRWRAMVKAGAVQACACVVCGMDEAHAMAAMVATDDKAPLTEAELSRGVQQMLAVGVAPEAVDKAARLKRGTARRVAKVAGAGTVQASIDQLLAAEEFEDEADRAAVLEAPSDGWETAAARIRERIEREAAVAELRAACEAAGLSLVDEKPEGFCDAGWFYAEQLADAELPEGAVGVLDLSRSGLRPNVDVYVPDDGEEDEADGPTPFAKEAERCRELCAAAHDARSGWLASRLLDDDWAERLTPVLEAARALGRDPQPYNWSVSDWMGANLPENVSIVVKGHIVDAFLFLSHKQPVYVDADTGRPFTYHYMADKSRRWLALGEALASCGYEAGPGEAALEELVRTALQKLEEESEEDDER